MNTHKQYPTNVTQAQWHLLIPLLPKRKWRKGSRGRPPVNVQDRDGLKQVLNQYFDTGETRLRKLWVDGGYRGEDLKLWVANKK